MYAIATAVITAVITAVLGGFVGYVLGNRRVRYERLYERQAEVIAKLSELLWQVQKTALRATGAAHEDRRRLLEQSEAAANTLLDYYASNRVWLDPKTLATIGRSLHDISIAAGQFQSSLDTYGRSLKPEGKVAAERIKSIVPTLNRELEFAFRAILYPPPWYAAPLNALRWLDAKVKRSSTERNSGRQP